MTVYIEYAFLENFLLDGMLLYLSLKAARQKISRKGLLFASALGGIFALVFPFLLLENFLSYLLKFSVGFLLCFIAFGRIKTKNEWGRYALNCTFFFALTFSFAGIFEFLGIGVFAIFAFHVLFFLAFAFIKKMQQKKSVDRYIYDCKISYKQRSVEVFGFYDSGNFATHENSPICFLAPDAFFELLQEEFEKLFEKETGRVCDEAEIVTMSGKRRLRLFKGVLEIKNVKKIIKKEVYFALSKNIISREYKLILHSRIFEE